MTERPTQPLPPGVPNEAPPAKPRRSEYEPPKLTKEPTGEKPHTLSSVQDYFKLVKARAQNLYGLVSVEVDRFAKKNGGTDDARLMRLRLEYLALEEVMDQVDRKIARVKKQTQPPEKAT